MKLTGLALDAFKERHYNSKNQFSLNNIPFDELPETCQNALIIEFFDSVGIYISIINTKDLHQFICEDDFKNHHQRNNDFESRTEATNAAIIKANVIYNESKL